MDEHVATSSDRATDVDMSIKVDSSAGPMEVDSYGQHYESHDVPMTDNLPVARQSVWFSIFKPGSDPLDRVSSGPSAASTTPAKRDFKDFMKAQGYQTSIAKYISKPLWEWTKHTTQQGGSPRKTFIRQHAGFRYFFRVEKRSPRTWVQREVREKKDRVNEAKAKLVKNELAVLSVSRRKLQENRQQLAEREAHLRGLEQHNVEAEAQLQREQQKIEFEYAQISHAQVEIIERARQFKNLDYEKVKHDQQHLQMLRLEKDLADKETHISERERHVAEKEKQNAQDERQIDEKIRVFNENKCKNIEMERSVAKREEKAMKLENKLEQKFSQLAKWEGKMEAREAALDDQQVQRPMPSSDDASRTVSKGKRKRTLSLPQEEEMTLTTLAKPLSPAGHGAFNTAAGRLRLLNATIVNGQTPGQHPIRPIRTCIERPSKKRE